MMKVDISTALFLYLFVSVVLVFLLWLFIDFGTRQREYSSEEKNLWHCSICDNTYIDSRHEGISKCPKCGSYIERVEELAE